MTGPNIKGNPLKISVYLLVLSYVVGEFIFPKYPLLYLFHLIGILGLIASSSFFIAGFSLFKSHGENPSPTTSTSRLITTGIFSYSRNPIYLAFIGFFLSMFLIFENVMYILSAIGLAIWLHHWVIKIEEEYLYNKFKEKFDQYNSSVKRWLFF